MDVTAVERLGYSVAVNDEDAGTEFPYTIYGRRGAKYGLMRNVNDPHLLFAVNWRGWTRSAKVGGYEWFTDRDDKLVPVR
jgi:hypothetical protein